MVCAFCPVLFLGSLSFSGIADISELCEALKTNTVVKELKYVLYLYRVGVYARWRGMLASLRPSLSSQACRMLVRAARGYICLCRVGPCRDVACVWLAPDGRGMIRLLTLFRLIPLLPCLMVRVQFET